MSVPPAFGMALNPLRPDEITPPPGMAERPPYCPTCPEDVLLYPGMQNGAGDTLFSCGNDGYEAIFRVEGATWVPRPGREVSRWEAPRMAPRGAPAAPSALQSAPSPPDPVQVAFPVLDAAPEPAPARVEPLVPVSPAAVAALFPAPWERPAPEPVPEPEPEPQPAARLLPPVLLIEPDADPDDRVTPIED